MFQERRGSARQDYKQAIKWWRKVAQQGETVALHNLGGMYFQGHGVRQNYKKAVEWFQKAAEQGHNEAMFDLGVIHAKGMGVRQDYVKAHMWLDLAARQTIDAQMQRTVLGAMMLRKQIPRQSAWRRSGWRSTKSKGNV